MATVAFPERIMMTLDEFLALPEQDENGNHFELDEGELITLSPTGAPHARRVTKISSYLDRLLDSATYEVLTGEAGILMALEPKPVVRGMDVTVLYAKDMPAKGMLRKAPLLVVEVVSPGNDPIDLERKRKQYQDFGTEEIWFVYEETKSIYVYGGSGTPVELYECPGEFQSRALGVKIATGELFR